MSGSRKRFAGITGTIILILAVGALFAWRFHVLSSPDTVSSIRSVQGTDGTPVEVAVVRSGHLETRTILAGTVEGIEQYALVSNNRLRVERILHREGDHVEAGDPLILLEKTASSPMQHSYQKYLALYEDAERDFQRYTELHEEGAVSAQTLDKARMNLKVARTNLDDAKEATDLHAPRAGQIMSVLVEEGETVKPGEPLAWIAKTDSVRVVFEAGSRQALELAVGQSAIWRHPTRGGVLTGAISQLNLAADTRTHLLTGKALFPNPENLLMPGLLVSIEIETANRENVLTVPVAALEKTPTGYAVFVIENAGAANPTVRLRDIRVGLKTTDLVEVISGLRPGDQAVIFGKTMIADGDKVRVISVAGDN